MSIEKFNNIGNNEINLLKAFFIVLGEKLKDKIDLQMIAKANKAISELPNVPLDNVFVNFEHENQIFTVSLSDYKIELDCYLQDYHEDENGNKSDFEQVQQYCFKYEQEGYTDVVGSFDQFKLELLQALENADVTAIYINEEE